MLRSALFDLLCLISGYESIKPTIELTFPLSTAVLQRNTSFIKKLEKFVLYRKRRSYVHFTYQNHVFMKTMK